MSTILVSGAIANKPLSGGEAWVRMSWVRGLRRLGYDVCLIEQIESSQCVDELGRTVELERSVNRRTFETAVEALAPDCPAALICDGGPTTVGLDLEDVVDRAQGAELLVNISGHLDIEPIKAGPSRRAYVDVDPGFTQIWAESGIDARLEGHDSYFTVGENIGGEGCTIPTAGIDWLPLPPPVTLEDWPAMPLAGHDRFTTVATWRSPLGTLSHGDVDFAGKHHQWRRMVELPHLSPQTFEIALQIAAEDFDDRTALEAAGWRLVDPLLVAGDPLAFRSYVQGSAAELSVAHPVYVDTGSGWVSDRTVRYLASGRPALVQDTGIERRYPVGEGLVTFGDVEQAAAGAAAIAADYRAHSQAARSLAESYFDSDVVLGRFLEAALAT
jgi:hypothetical protein